MEKDIINENKIIEITKPLSMEDYTGDNSPSKCFNIDKNEYAIAKENEELFASIDEDTIILSVKESERLLIKGDFNALEAFSFLYRLDYLSDSELYVISNNDFDIDKFRELKNNVFPNDIYYEQIEDNDIDCCINVTDKELKVSSDKGFVEVKDLLNKEQNRVR